MEAVPSLSSRAHGNSSQSFPIVTNYGNPQKQPEQTPPQQDSKQKEPENKLPLSKTLNATRDHKTANKPTTPNTPETFPAAAKSAAILGQPQTISYTPEWWETLHQPKQPDPQKKTTPPIQNTLKIKTRQTTNNNSTPTTREFKSPPLVAQQAVPSRQRTIEVISDRQEYDQQRRIITAEGNVVVRFDGAVVDADRLQVNLNNLIAVGSGNVALTRGDQILRGQSFKYNFLQDQGEIDNASGEIFIPSAQTDLTFSPTDNNPRDIQPTVSDRVRRNQPLSGITSPGGIDFTLGGTIDASNIPLPKPGGQVRRLRFEAQRIEFYPRGWQGLDVRITNDPFSPPELELRASKVTSIRESPLVETIKTQGQGLVFDQTISLPIPVDTQTIDRFQRDPSPFYVSPGFDGDKRGGFFVERGFTVVDTNQTRLRITPQLFVQKALQDSTDVSSLFGIKTKFNSVLSKQATLEGYSELTSFNLNKVDENLRASARMRQTLGDINPHILNLEYSYRDRLYNGTLGFQTVQSSIGGLISSPVIPLGNGGVNLNYQAGAQYINANTDRLDLLPANPTNNRISLGRLQGSVSLSKSFLVWQGQPLPPTPTQGLKYTSNPLVPYLQTIASLTGTSSYYTNGENQTTLNGTISLVGQFGNFSRPYLDYTAFNITYSQGINSGLSPFLFDRSVDNKVLGAGISQQIYGPLRLGFQTTVNLDTGKQTSTDYILEYSRRTYGLTLRYNPVLELGGFSIRISDFNWTGGTTPFSGNEVKSVVDGVRREN